MEREGTTGGLVSVLREIIRLSGVLHPAGAVVGQVPSFADRRIHLSLLDDHYTLALHACVKEEMKEVAETLRKFKDLAFELTDAVAWQEMLDQLTSYLFQLIEVVTPRQPVCAPVPA